MAKSSYLTFTCPSCGTKLAGIEPLDSATQIVTRTCRECGDRWQLVVRAVKVADELRIDRAEFRFKDNRFTRNDFSTRRTQ